MICYKWDSVVININMCSHIAYLLDLMQMLAVKLSISVNIEIRFNTWKSDRLMFEQRCIAVRSTFFEGKVIEM